MASWIHRLTVSKQSTGLYLIQQEQGWHAYRVDLKREKGQILLEDKQEGEGSIEDILGEIPAGRPLYLSLEARGILHRTVVASSPADAVRQTFPNIDPNSVFTQVLPVGDNYQLSLARLEVLEPLLAPFAKAKRMAYGLQLGPWASAQLAPATDLEGSHGLQIGKHGFTFDGGTWQAATPPADATMATCWRIGDDELEAAFLPAYAAGLHYFLAPPSLDAQEQDPTLDQRREGLYQRLYRRMAPALLGLAFMLVLINAIWFAQLHQGSESLNQRYSAEAKQIREYEELQKEISNRQKFLAQMGWGTPPPMVYYSDQIGQTIPTDIRLTELSIHPIDESEQERNRRLVFIPGLIRVEGISKEPLALNRWVADLEALNWVASIQEVAYQKLRRETGGTFAFTIHVAP